MFYFFGMQSNTGMSEGHHYFRACYIVYMVYYTEFWTQFSLQAL